MTRLLLVVAVAAMTGAACSSGQPNGSSDQPVGVPCGSDLQVKVSAKANIFGAGMADPPAPAGGGGGVGPACVAIPSGTIAIRDARNYDFARLEPALGQLFFIGDGRAGSGRLQRFDVPTGASNLYLGIADAFSFDGPPGSYAENAGSFRVDVRFE